MTRLGQLYADEITEAVEKAMEKERKEAMEEKLASATNCLREGDTVEKVSRCLKLPRKQVEELKRKLL